MCKYNGRDIVMYRADQNSHGYVKGETDFIVHTQPW